MPLKQIRELYLSSGSQGVIRKPEGAFGKNSPLSKMHPPKLRRLEDFAYSREGLEVGRGPREGRPGRRDGKLAGGKPHLQNCVCRASLGKEAC